jgi:hypothetical protein
LDRGGWAAEEIRGSEVELSVFMGVWVSVGWACQSDERLRG